MAMQEKDVQRIANQYMKYLNGPLGKNVISHLKEGETCTIKTHDRTLQITRQHGKAVVKVINSVSESNFVKSEM